MVYTNAIEDTEVNWFIHLWGKDKTYLCMGRASGSIKAIKPEREISLLPRDVPGQRVTLPLVFNTEEDGLLREVCYCTISEDPDEQGKILYSRD